MAGLASLYKMGDPLAYRLTGIVINQSDVPWWYAGILNWLGMVHAMQQATGDIGREYGAMVKMAIDGTLTYPLVSEKTGKQTLLYGPAAVYGVYQSFCLKVNQEAHR
jgi:hypothetical protein